MILDCEKQVRQVIQVAVATALACWGFPGLALILIILLLPWQPFFWIAGYLGEGFLKIRVRKLVSRAQERLNKEPVHVT